MKDTRVEELKEAADHYEDEAARARKAGDKQVAAFSAGYANGIRLALRRLGMVARDVPRKKRTRRFRI